MQFLSNARFVALFRMSMLEQTVGSDSRGCEEEEGVGGALHCD